MVHGNYATNINQSMAGPRRDSLDEENGLEEVKEEHTSGESSGNAFEGVQNITSTFMDQSGFSYFKTIDEMQNLSRPSTRKRGETLH